VPSPTAANEIDHWIMAKSGPWTPDPTGFQWKLYELHHKDVPGKNARGKVYDLHPHLIRQTFDEIKHWLTRHVEVADRVKGLSTRIGRNFHCFRDPSRPQDWWVIDDWIDGPSMAEVLAVGPLERAQALHVMLQVAEVLHLLHAEGLIYRALAPRSIFLTPTGAVVTNFELTKILEGGLTVMPLEQWPNWDVFVAPEVRGREKVRPSVDLYSWAMILAYALTGKKPTGPDPAIQCIADSGLPSDVTTFATDCLLSKKRPDSFERLLASRKSSDDQQGAFRGR
jgi:serine/threonine protein kinase